jgi:hypothetical protein
MRETTTKKKKTKESRRSQGEYKSSGESGSQQHQVKKTKVGDAQTKYNSRENE